METDIKRFLDDDGKVKQFPSKQNVRLLIYAYIADKFEFNRDYTEHEVNSIISEWHTFGDYFMLRRGLIESGEMSRLRNGSKYWRNDKALIPKDE
ncbi:MAG: DUF2087 domain-containing protein [Clostridia bacterium]